MRRDNQPWRPMPRPALVWNEDGSPGSAAFGDIYFSRENGLAESRHVFLAGNQLPRRWQDHPRERFVVAETGFGTGLNCLATWQAWARLPEARPALHYVAFEQFPLRRDELARALKQWPELAVFSSALLAAYPAPLPGCHRVLLKEEETGSELTLDLWWEEAGTALADLDQRGLPLIDAWYLDGFAPARNAAMWQSDLLGRLGSLSQAGATVATFTAAGQVRRDLQTAGFRMYKSPGFGRKREQLRGELEATPAATGAATLPAGTPWDLSDTPAKRPANALVLGAGLAGCATAAALARRGIAVTLLERDALAGAASGNAQGVLYTRLSPRHSQLVDFALQSYQFAHRHYAGLFATATLREGVDGALCGSFHQHPDDTELAQMAERLQEIPELAEVLDASRASERLGVEQGSAGYWYPDSGWLHPPSVCRAWASQKDIVLLEHCGELDLRREGDQWQAHDHSGEVIAAADCAIIACAGASKAFSGLDWLPLQIIRGQTSQLPAGEPFAALRAVLCHDGYIAPSRGEHCIGATFKLGDKDSAQRIDDHRCNLTQLAKALPAWRSALDRIDPETLSGRTGFRCTSSDYLPLVGPVPELTGFIERFASLRRNARRDISAAGSYVEGLFLNTGHGSRGLTSTPLAAELLASMICAEPPPLSRNQCRALAPARFLIRDLGRNRL